VNKLPPQKPSKIHWVAHLQGLFPQTETPLTSEMTQAMAEIMADYSEKVLADVCGSKGICTKEEFFPSIAKLKKYLDEAAAQEALPAKQSEKVVRLFAERQSYQEDRSTRPTLKEIKAKYGENYGLNDYRPAKPLDDTSDCYKGPIEDIKPGDILHWSRMEEYKSFIRTKGVTPKLWGVDETWRDTGQRPFSTPKKDEDKNPFI